jgi:tripartite-type tricarboxylate transporter receptor subunit TctC
MADTSRDRSPDRSEHPAPAGPLGQVVPDRAGLTRRAALAAAAALGLPGIARAQGAGQPGWAPTKQVNWIVPGGPGSVLDVGARLIAQKMAPVLGQSVTIDNRVGAGGIVAAELAARAAPDGHTVFYGNFAVFAIAPLLFKGLRWDARRDFVAIHGIGASPNIVVVAPERPWKTIPELIAFSRENPGKIAFAASIGSGQHMATELFLSVTGLQWTHVPYNNTVQALTDISAGRVDLMFDYPLSSLPFVRDGRLRALGINAKQRLTIAREIPTLDEQGVKGAELLGWAGLYAPARTPQPALAKLAEATRVALRDPEVIALFDSTGTILWPDVDAAKLEAALAEEIPRMQALVARTGIQAQ